MTHGQSFNKRVMIRVEGGVVVSVFSDHPVDVTIINYDIAECSEPGPVKINLRADRFCAVVLPEECNRVDKALLDMEENDGEWTAAPTKNGTRRGRRQRKATVER